MSTIAALFPPSYEASRDRFRQELAGIQARWPQAQLHSRAVADDPELATDWIAAPALEGQERVLLFTTAEHGIEGYVGSAVQQVFMRELLPRLEPRNTALCLVHAINPWGMKHRRRVNEHNVDLNRNFVPRREMLDPAFNPDYIELTPLLLPPGPVGGRLARNLGFALRLARTLLSRGIDGPRQAALLGQYRLPQGIYYGGRDYQRPVQLVIDLYRQALRQHGQVLQLDMHTGYGPRYQMSVVNSWMEPRSSQELSALFAYPLVVKNNAEEFYVVQGDMIDLVYTLQRDEFPDRRLYATSFEFGTYGHTLADNLRSMRSMILENQLYWYGARNESVRERVLADFRALFAPEEDDWREKAVADARQAMEGILRGEEFI